MVKEDNLRPQINNISAINHYQWMINDKSFVTIVVGLLACITSITILDAYFNGEDEATALFLARQIYFDLSNGNFKNAAFFLLSYTHPPAPLLIVVPFIPLVGYNEITLRLPNLFLWSAVCMVATRVGWKIGSFRVGLITGICLAVSGIFNLEAHGFGLGGETLSVFLLVLLLVDQFQWNLNSSDAIKKYCLGSLSLCIGFLFFTSILPIIVTYHCLFLLLSLKSSPGCNTLKKYLVYTTPFILFYLIYHVIFFGLPMYLVYFKNYHLFGQINQNLHRANTAHFNIVSLFGNLRVLNWFVLPFLSWIILLAGIVYQAKYEFPIFLILVGFGCIWSFYLKGNTGHHFLSYFCWLAPFGVKALEHLTINTKLKNFFWTFFILGIGIWAYQIHIKTYDHDNYPKSLEKYLWADPLGWPNNMDRPMFQIADLLRKGLDQDEKYISTIDGALPIYYFPEKSKYLPGGKSLFDIRISSDNHCMFLPDKVATQYNVHIIVSYVHENVCSSQIDKVTKFPGSNIQLTILKR